MLLPESVISESAAAHTEQAILHALAGRRAKEKPVLRQKTKVGDLFETYLSWYRLHRKQSSWKDVSGVWENSLKATFGDLDVAEVDEAHFTLHQQLRSMTVSNRTINKELDYFSGFLTWCRREKRFSELVRIQYEELPCSKPLPIILSFDEVARIIRAAKSHLVYHALLLVLYCTGARITSITTLQVKHFDPENQAVLVQVKGGAWKLLPITKEAAEAVKKVIEKKKDKPEDYIFTVRKSGEPLKNIRPALKRMAAKAGVTKWVHPHLLRHSIATHMLAAGVDLRTVQEMLGHSQVSTTEIYTHIDISHLREAQRKTRVYGKTK